ncbi:probable splicing factor 3B subunit 4 [Coccomyxa sp. Obi]|nr:probable splicing factor 3B subunit 4 [Coccomyxa sp. Obi]
MTDQTPTDTLYLGGLDQRVTRRILYDLCIQAGPVVRIHIPEEEGGTHRGYAFCQFTSVESATYAHRLFQDLVLLFGRPLRVRYSHSGSTA